MQLVDVVRKGRGIERNTSGSGSENGKGRTRLVGLAGLGFLAALVPAMGSVPEPPGTGASFERIATYYADNVNGQLVSTFLWALALTVFLLFIGAFHAVLRSAEGGNGTLSLTALGSGVVAITVMIVGQAATGATAIIASEDVDPAIVRAMDEMSHMIAHLFGIPLGSFLIATSIITFAHRVTWRWLGVLGIAAGLLVIVGTAGIFEPESMIHNLGVLGLFGFLIWTLGTSISVLRPEVPARAAVREPGVPAGIETSS